MTDLARRINGGVVSITGLIEAIPVIATALNRAVDPTSGGVRLDYAPPALSVPAGQAPQVCAAVQTVTGQPCPGVRDGRVAVPSVPALLGAVSAR